MVDPVVDLQQLIEEYKADPAMTPAKWVEWACVCAERVLPIYEAKYPEDRRPRDAVLAARVWLDNPTKESADAANAATRAAYAATRAVYAAAKAADAAADAAANAAYAAADAANAAKAATRAANAATRAADITQWQAFQLMRIYHNN